MEQPDWNGLILGCARAFRQAARPDMALDAGGLSLGEGDQVAEAVQGVVQEEADTGVVLRTDPVDGALVLWHGSGEEEWADPGQLRRQ